jgi:hypothetical protein
MFSKFFALITISISLLRRQANCRKLARQSSLAGFCAREKFFGEHPANILWCTYRLAQT